MSTMTQTTTPARRGPLNRELRKAGTSPLEIAELVDQLRGAEWLLALDLVRVLAESPVAARAIAAVAIDALAVELHRVGDLVRAQDLLEGVAFFGWIDSAAPRDLRIAYQLFDQATPDAGGQRMPDRFAELLDQDPRVAARALTGAVILLTHTFPDHASRP
jgi:hypothetical protein